jgi:TorA maturation chaperone TorD
MTSSSPLQFAQGDDAEELSRAELYGLLAQLWIAPPGSDLMQRLQGAATQPAEPGTVLEAPWQALLGTMRATTAQAAADEYDALFQGVGKPEIFLYSSYYLSGFLNERPLVQLRHDLRDLDLTRDTARAETEDHVAFVFEVMRYLIAGDDAAVCNLERQRRFFRAHLQTWVDRLCDEVEVHPRASIWRAVAALTRSFMRVETQGFDMLET